MNVLLCLVGPSGCGKTTQAELYGGISVESYTTRPKRYPEEKGHIFVDDAHFPDMKDIVAYNVYNGYKYGATKEQIDNSDVYVVDIPGIIDLKKNYKGNKKLVVIGLSISPEVARERMAKRGDSEEKINERIASDTEAFKDLKKYCNIVINCDEVTRDFVQAQIKGFCKIYEEYDL